MSSSPQQLQVGEWRIEPELDLVARNGHAVKIEPRAMRLLLCLTARAGHVVTVDELLEEVWPDVVVGPDSVYQAVGLLRRTLGDDRHHPSYIAHVPRKGYRLVAPVAELNGALPAAPPPVVPAPAAVAAASAPVETAAGPSSHGAQPRRLPRIAWLALAVALGVLGAAWLYLRVNPQPLQRAAAPRAAAAASARVAPAVSPPSIAVLPFIDMTEKQDFGYFADGLAEELIDLLSRGSDLRVPARTSSFYFKGRATTIRDIAQALGVEHLLEGSVRRSGNRVRVTAQLIRADNGYHLWSQTYDRELTEVFGVEDDIARAVTDTLQAKLVTARAAGAAASGEARNLQLQCQFFVQRNTHADADKAVECYRRVLALAPRDAPAWAGYADALWRQGALNGPPAQSGALTRQARAAAEHALALDPALAQAHAVLAVYHRVIEGDWDAAGAEVRAALSADPADPSSLLAAAILARNLGEFSRAIDFCERARARDPLNFLSYARLTTIYLYLGRLPEAEAAARRRLDLSPEGLGGHEQLGDVLLARGQPQAALEADQREPEEEARLVGLALAYHALGRRAEADAALAELRGRFRRAATDIADVYAYRGETDHAFAALEEAFAAHDANLLAIKSDNYLIPLHADPRYAALLRRLKLPLRDPA